MLNEDWFAMHDTVGPGFTTFALQTHVFCWSFVSTCADGFCPTSNDCRECNNGSSIASAACSTELAHSGANHKETTHSNNSAEVDAGVCFTQPNAMHERIERQPTTGLLKFLIRCESLVFAPRTKMFRWSLISGCVVERTTTE